jgi:hypothetical protein
MGAAGIYGCLPWRDAPWPGCPPPGSRQFLIEHIVVDKNRITFNASGIRCINTGRIRVHTHDFPVHRLLVIKGVDRIQMRSFPLYQCLI